MKDEVGKRVIIIGAGITGLTAAMRLVSQGCGVTVVDSSSSVGGLAGSIMLDGTPVDIYYHFICREDNDLVNFVDELGLTNKLHWREAGTSSFLRGKTYPFNTPQDLLKFDPIPFLQRLRFGIHVALSQFRKGWLGLDGIAAKPWLIQNIGQKAYEAIWDPLLRIKFGVYHEEISAAWIWHRIHRVSRSRASFFGMNSYGFLEEGCHTLMETMLEKLHQFQNFSLVLDSKVSKIRVENNTVKGIEITDKDLMESDCVISTCSIPQFLKLTDTLGQYGASLASIDYLNVICILLEIDRPFSNSFWLNINDPRIPFNGIVETTNLNPRMDLNGGRLIYIPYYLSGNDPKWSRGDSQLLDESLAALKLIRPDFSERWVIKKYVFRDLNAQAVCKVGFSKKIPNMRTPVNGLFVTDSAQYYPEDRTMSASVRLGTKVASLAGNGMGPQNY
jgi:protoporphyrinogen oxidase